MHAGALRALEFDRIVEAVRRFALTPPELRGSRAAAARRRGIGVAPRLRATTETVRFLADNQLRLHAPEDLETILESLGVRDARSKPLPPARTGDVSRLGRDHLRRWCGAPRSALSGAAARLPTAPPRSSARWPTSAGKSIPRGEVVDDASPELKSIRDRLRKQRARLRGTLESYLRGKDTRNTCSSRSSPIATAATCWSFDRSIGRRSPASCTAVRAAAQACSSSRSAPSKSTTTSSRSSSRKPRRCDAFFSR